MVYHFSIFPFNLVSFSSVSCGDNFMIILTTDGNVLSIGNNYYGQLGIGSYENSSDCKKINNIN